MGLGQHGSQVAISPVLASRELEFPLPVFPSVRPWRGIDAQSILFGGQASKEFEDVALRQRWEDIYKIGVFAECRFLCCHWRSSVALHLLVHALGGSRNVV